MTGACPPRVAAQIHRLFICQHHYTRPARPRQSPSPIFVRRGAGSVAKARFPAQAADLTLNLLLQALISGYVSAGQNTLPGQRLHRDLPAAGKGTIPVHQRTQGLRRNPGQLQLGSLRKIDAVSGVKLPLYDQPDELLILMLADLNRHPGIALADVMQDADRQHAVRVAAAGQIPPAGKALVPAEMDVADDLLLLPQYPPDPGENRRANSVGCTPRAVGTNSGTPSSSESFAMDLESACRETNSCRAARLMFLSPHTVTKYCICLSSILFPPFSVIIADHRDSYYSQIETSYKREAKKGSGDWSPG